MNEPGWRCDLACVKNGFRVAGQLSAVSYGTIGLLTLNSAHLHDYHRATAIEASLPQEEHA